MDIKRVLQVLLRDITDLQQFVEEVKSDASPGITDLELIETRLSGIKHMLERSAEGMGELQRQLYAAEQRANALASAVVPVSVETSGKEISKQNEPSNLAPENKAPKVEVQEQIREVTEAVESEQPPVATAVEVDIPVTEVKNPEAEVSVEEPVGDRVDLVENPGDHAVLGEKFSQSKSLNDLLVEQGKGDSKYSHMPIISLQAAVGINDRFLFTRELFDGNAQHYQEVMARLDGMQNLQEAAAFLRSTFTWKKNDTSLKFIELVRRRFQS